MAILRTIAAYLAATAGAYVLASIFYTQQIIADQAAIGARYTVGQQAETYLINLSGLWLYGAMIAIALAVGFLVAAGVKRILKPLSLIAYPAAGAAAIFVLLMLVEQQLGGGAGVIGGARTPLGVALQCVAGFAGGLVFAALRAR